MKNTTMLTACLLITTMLVPAMASAGRPPPSPPVDFLFGEDWATDNYIIIVGNTYYSDYSASIWQHYNDTTGDYAVRVYQDIDEDQDAIRAWLSAQYDTYGAFHLLLVGMYDIDLGWWEDVGVNGWDSPLRYPLLEKYYNLDGKFLDRDRDGAYDWLDDKKTEPLTRELYVGVMMFTSAAAINENFTKVHSFITRDQSFMLPYEASVIGDEDFIQYNVNESVETVFSTTSYIEDGNYSLHFDVADDAVFWHHYETHGMHYFQSYNTSTGWEYVGWNEMHGNYAGHIGFLTACCGGGFYYNCLIDSYMNNDKSVALLAYPKGSLINDYDEFYDALSWGYTLAEAANYYEDANPEGQGADWGLSVYGPPILTV